MWLSWSGRRVIWRIEEFVEHGFDDGLGDGEGVWGDELEVVLIGVPPGGVLEVANEVDGGDADLVEGDVVVEDLAVGHAEDVCVAGFLGSAVHDCDELGRGVGGNPDGEVAVAYHVEEDAEGGFFRGVAPAGGVLAGAIDAVEDAAGFGSHVLFEGFFAVEEDELELGGLVGFVFGEFVGEGEDESAGGGGVVGAEEAALGVVFGVVVGAEESGDGLFPGVGAWSGGKAGEDVGEFFDTERGLGIEGLVGDGPAGGAQSAGEVGADFGTAGGGGRSGSEGEDVFGVFVGCA